VAPTVNTSLETREEGIPLRRSRRLAVAVLSATFAIGSLLPAVSAAPAGASYIVTLSDDAVAKQDADPFVIPRTKSTKGDESDDGPILLPKIDKQKVARAVASLKSGVGFKPTNVYDAVLGGFAARLTPGQVRQLERNPIVESVTPDRATSLDEADQVRIAAVKTTTNAAPKMPAGIVRVGATKNSIAKIDGDDQRVNADVAILDTGVDAAHTDLNVVGGYNCTGSNRGNWGDNHGHGTHVAGTVGALDNGWGVVGVAPGARLWSVKVLDSRGTGLLSWLVCGIDWVTAQKDSGAPSGQRIEVANMSLRFGLSRLDPDCGYATGDNVHKAICRSTRAGVAYAVAAGNDTTNARKYRPAAYPQVITVGATVDYDGKPGGLARQADYCSFYSADADDTWANFSNYGAVLDLVAPGKCVISTYPGLGYAWMSGTSMATPLVAGAAALYRVQYPGAQPQQVRMALQHVAVRDWRTSTYPVSSPPRQLNAASFGPPPEFDFSAADPSGWVGNMSPIAISVSRAFGHTAPLAMSVSSGPSGLKGTGTVSGGSGTMFLKVSPDTPSGDYRITVQATDGELVRTHRIDIQLDAQPPKGSFDSPDNGQTIQSSTSVLISWNESDTGGSGIKERSLQRQRASIPSGGLCADGSWSNVGSPVTTKGDVVQTVNSGYCFRWRLILRDKAGNSSLTTSGAVLVGSAEMLAGPSVSKPTVALRPNVKTKPDGRVRLDVSWSSASAVGVGSHQLRVSRNGGSSWSSVSLPNPSATKAVVVLAPGSNLVVGVRARDGMGNWSGWVNSAAFSLTLVQAEGGTPTVSGKWTVASMTKTLATKVRHSSTKGASAGFTFSGRQVGIVSLESSNRGKADVYVNGNLATTLNLRSSTTNKRVVVFTRTWAKSNERTIEVRVRGTASGPRVDLDAFVVLGD